LYGHPDFQKRGLGSGLIRRVVAVARQRGLRGLLVKAERVSTGYFDALGFERLPESDAPGAAYPYRYWLELSTP
jgi:N-acetylglutamate synthase-like GNAT family acetyltransferase